jgi:hypothetical protein
MEVSINSMMAAETVVITIIAFANPLSDAIVYLSTVINTLIPALKLFLKAA